MNYYEHHLGDYAEATGHLSFVEDAAYSRLMRKAYATERGLPAEKKAVQRLVGARTKEERDAVDAVLAEFWVLQEDGWHNERCDREIARFQEGEPEREVKKANEDNRLKRHREERSRLFKVLTDAGQHAPWNVGMSELRELVKRVTATEPDTPPETDPPPLPATAPATPATATQTPDTRHQTPEEEKENTRSGPSTSGGRVCLALKQVGLPGLNPGHPDLLALIEAGATEAEFVGAAQTAIDRGKGFAYAIGTLKRQRIEAANSAKAMHTGPLPQAPPHRSATDRQIATMNALTGKDRNDDRRPSPAADTIDVAARVVR